MKETSIYTAAVKGLLRELGETAEEAFPISTDGAGANLMVLFPEEPAVAQGCD